MGLKMNQLLDVDDFASDESDFQIFVDVDLFHAEVDDFRGLAEESGHVVGGLAQLNGWGRLSGIRLLLLPLLPLCVLTLSLLLLILPGVCRLDLESLVDEVRDLSPISAVQIAFWKLKDDLRFS